MEGVGRGRGEKGEGYGGWPDHVRELTNWELDLF